MDFFLTDLASIFVAYLVCPLFFLLPGAAIGRLSNVFQFNECSLPLRFAISVVLSLSVIPIASYLCAKFVGLDATEIFLAAAGLGALAWLCSSLKQADKIFARVKREVKEHRIVFCIALGWTFVCPLMIMDLQNGRHIFNSVVLFDWSRNIAVGDAIRATGVPPNNFYLCHEEPFKLIYCYYWMLAGVLPAPVTQFLNPNNSFPSQLATSIWTGYGLISTIGILCKQLYQKNVRNVVRNAVCLLSLGGLHIFICEMLCLDNKFVLPTMEWNGSIVGVAQAALWVPQHLTSLIAGTIGSLILFETMTSKDRMPWRIALAATAFASAFGCSPYVTVPFVGFWVFYALVFLIRRSYRDFAVSAGAGVGAGILSLPLLMELHSFHRPNQLGLGLPLFRANNYTAKPLPEMLHIPEPLQSPFILCVLVPLRLLAGLAPQIFASLWYWSKKLHTRTDVYCAPMILVCLLCSTFLHSSGFAATNDDMAQRSFIPMQILLTIWTARALDSDLFWKAKLISRPIVLMALLGALACPTEYYVLRHYTMDPKPVTMDSGRIYCAREAFAKVDEVLDKNARVAADIDIDLFPDRIFTVLYAHRQQLAGDRRRSVVFGGTDQAYDDVVNATARVLNDGRQQDFETLFKRFKVGALMVSDTNPVWSKPDSWLMKQKPFFANDHFKAYTADILKH